jgi:hypothetical protein
MDLNPIIRALINFAASRLGRKTLAPYTEAEVALVLTDTKKAVKKPLDRLTKHLSSSVGYIRFSQTCILRHERLGKTFDKWLETEENPPHSIAVLYTHKLERRHTRGPHQR